MIDETTFYTTVGALGGFSLFLLHRLFTLNAKVAKVETAIEYKNEKLETIEARVNKIGDAVDALNVTVAALNQKVKG